MLQDGDRNKKYRQAIHACIEDFKRKEHRKPVILDVGCGTGMLTAIALESNDVQHVIAVDTNVNMTQIVREMGKKDIKANRLTVFNGTIIDYVTDCRGESTERFVDIVVSEILGTLHTSESMPLYLNQVAPYLNVFTSRQVYCVPQSACTLANPVVLSVTRNKAEEEGIIESFRKRLVDEIVSTSMWTPTNQWGMLPFNHPQNDVRFIYNDNNAHKLRTDHFKKLTEDCMSFEECHQNAVYMQQSKTLVWNTEALEEEDDSNNVPLLFLEFHVELWTDIFVNNTISSYNTDSNKGAYGEMNEEMEEDREEGEEEEAEDEHLEGEKACDSDVEMDGQGENEDEKDRFEQNGARVGHWGFFVTRVHIPDGVSLVKMSLVGNKYETIPALNLTFIGSVSDSKKHVQKVSGIADVPIPQRDAMCASFFVHVASKQLFSEAHQAQNSFAQQLCIFLNDGLLGLLFAQRFPKAKIQLYETDPRLTLLFRTFVSELKSIEDNSRITVGSNSRSLGRGEADYSLVVGNRTLLSDTLQDDETLESDQKKLFHKIWHSILFRMNSAKEPIYFPKLYVETDIEWFNWSEVAETFAATFKPIQMGIEAFLPRLKMTAKTKSPFLYTNCAVGGANFMFWQIHQKRNQQRNEQDRALLIRRVVMLTERRQSRLDSQYAFGSVIGERLIDVTDLMRSKTVKLSQLHFGLKKSNGSKKHTSSKKKKSKHGSKKKKSNANAEDDDEDDSSEEARKPQLCVWFE